MPTNRPNAITRRILAAALLSTSIFASAQFVGNNPQAVEKRVDDLLAKMTLDEKIDLFCAVVQKGRAYYT
jgi:beta-glucosidase